MATKYYGINDKWTDDSLENVIEVASEDGTVNSVKVNGVEYGGGGGGDAYIAAHVAIDTGGMSTKLDGVVVANYQQENEYFRAAVAESLNTMAVNNIVVPLAGNAEIPGTDLFLTLASGTSTTVSGDIADYGSGNLYITGDGTITVTA